MLDAPPSPAAAVLADPIRFDRFELRPRERRLLADGVALPIGARAFDVLALMVHRAGSLVSKAELLDTVWAGLVVEESNLTVQVSTLRKLLGGELIATIPGRGYRFTGRPSLPPATPAANGATMPVAAAATAAMRPALVGRQSDLDRLRAALAQPGCVTLAGPAGVGKTTLAQALAAEWAAGAVWVDLAPLSADASVTAALARALGQPVPGHEAELLPALGERLLVLDNAEHLADAVAALAAALLAADARRALLVTSQLPLALPAERVLRVEPLALPGGLADDDDGALALFVQRARAADHRFAPGAEAMPVLREICRQLDGLPLALEMAAARVPALGVRGLHDALAARFAVLTRGSRAAAQRHRTLQAAVDWSHGLLSAAEQRLFRTLAVFAGGFTLDLAVAVAADAEADRWAVVDTLAALVDRSLVAADAADPPRYRLLETLRAYAAARLADSGDEHAARRRHAAALRALFAAANEPGAADGCRGAALAEHDNARDALSWATRQAPGTAVPLAAVVCNVAVFSSWRLEALGWLEACAPIVDAPEVGAADRADWWVGLARQHAISGRPDAARIAARARALCREAGLPVALFNAGIAWARATLEPGDEMNAVLAELQTLHDAHPERQPRSTVALHGTLALCAGQRGDHEAELRHRRAERDAALRQGSQPVVDAAETNIVSTLCHLGRYDEALAQAEALVARLRTPRDEANLVYAMAMRSASWLRLGRHAEVRAAARELWERLAHYRLPHLACDWTLLLAREGRHADAARLRGFLLQASERGGEGMARTERATFSEAEALCRAALGDAAWEAAVADGRRLDEAGAFACLGV